MAALAEFVPLRAESVDSIRQRIDAGVNAGLDPANPSWTDTTPGGFFYDHTQVMGLEAELLWDFASTELPASVFLQFSWGVYLDNWGELLALPRKDEAQAVGVVTFDNTGEAVIIGTGAEVAAASSDPDAEPLVFLSTQTVIVPAGGTVDATVQAEAAGSQFNVAAGAVELMLSTFPGVTVTNASAMSSGADVESDEPYKTRLLLEFSASRGGGTQDDYVAEASARLGVEGVVVDPLWAGPGTVRLILTATGGQPLSSPALAAEQEFWDPAEAPGTGLGAAPIGHIVTVATVDVLNPAVSATLSLLDGYTITAEPGKEDISAAVTQAIKDYILSLRAGDDVLINRVRQAALSVAGVYDVPTVQIDSSSSNYTVGALQIANPGAVTLT